MNRLMKNKKGSIEGILIFVGLLFLLLLVGLAVVFGGMVTRWVGNEVIPLVSDLGMAGETNLTSTVSMVSAPINSLLNSMTWLTGVLYFMCLVGIFGIAFTYREAPSKWLMGFFFLLVLLLIIGSIFISNIYEGFYSGTDEVATNLHEFQLISYLILYSPLIFSIVAFIGGAIMFTGRQDEQYV